MDKDNAAAFHDRYVSFSASPYQIVHHGDFVSLFPQVKRNVRTDETATAGHKNEQRTNLLGNWRNNKLVITEFQGLRLI
jgi:hypothetical protein